MTLKMHIANSRYQEKIVLQEWDKESSAEVSPISIIENAVFGAFEPGKEYYIHFTPA